MGIANIKIFKSSQLDGKENIMFELTNVTDENLKYCSLAATTTEEKKIVFNAVTNPSDKLSKYINKEVTFSNVSMTATEIMERDDDGNPTGVLNKTVKTVLITPDGKGILSTSMGVARSLFDMFQIFGTPESWTEPMTCIVRQVEIGKNRTFRLEIV